MSNSLVGKSMIGAVAAVLLMALGFATMVSAVDQGGEPAERITMSPSSTDVNVDAGESVQGTMQVINDGDVAYGFSVYARPYSVSNERYEPNFTDQRTNTDVYTWVQFEQTSYQVQPGESVEIPYTLRVPADAAPGGHYGVLFAETDEQVLSGTGVARKKRVGNLLYVTVKGTYTTAGELKEFILPFWQTSAPLQSSARIANTGNSDFNATVSTVAKDLFGRTKFTYTGEPIILPGTTRLIEMKWENAPNFGIFKVDQTVRFLDKTHRNSGLVLLLPKWAPVTLIIIVGAGAAYALLQRRTTRR